MRRKHDIDLKHAKETAVRNAEALVKQKLESIS
jgi:hypothetical protein